MTKRRAWRTAQGAVAAPLAAGLLLAAGCGPADEEAGAAPDAARSRLVTHPRMATAVARAGTHLMSLRPSLGLGGEYGFALRGATEDERGRIHVRFDQTFRGVPVFAADAIVALAEGDTPTGVITSTQRDIDVSTVPRISATQAVSIVHSDMRPRGPYAAPPDAQLVVYPHQAERERAQRLRGPDAELNAEDLETYVERYSLAYYVHATLRNSAQETAARDYIIDANTGEIVAQWDALQTAAAVGTGKSAYSGTVSLNTDSVSGGFELRDTVRGMNIATYNMNHGAAGMGTIYVDADNTWGDGKNYVPGGSTTGDNGQTAAVDAHYGTQRTYDYYKNVHGRNGIDGMGRATYNVVHFATSFDNAFWDDGCFCMTYGDGSKFSVLTSLDVAGHEMTHGVTANTAKLVYRGESGGLNESMSDIHGTMVEYYARGGSGSMIGNTGGNFDLGDQLAMKPLRYMYKPSKDGKSADAWKVGLGNLDVHYSSGPMNRAFFFLSQGASSMTTSDFYSSYLPGGMTGLGNDKAARIAYHALATKMTSNTNYAGARAAFLAAATDLYGAGSAEIAAVEDAFGAINVGKPHGGGGTDTTAPTTKVTTPKLLATVKGTVTDSATATDDVAVTKVEFYAGKTLVGSTTTAPFSASWNTAMTKNGLYLFTSKAYDAAGNVGTSPNVLIAVKN